jgi:hypothetical protein
MLCFKENCQYFSGIVRRFLGITIMPSGKSTLCYFNHLGLIKRRKWPFAVEDESKRIEESLLLSRRDSSLRYAPFRMT